MKRLLHRNLSWFVISVVMIMMHGGYGSGVYQLFAKGLLLR